MGFGQIVVLFLLGLVVVAVAFIAWILVRATRRNQ